MTEDRIARAIEVIGEQLTRIADGMKDTVAIVEPKPAPDVGLVEAVKIFLDDEICGGYEKPTWEKHSVRHLQDALAAHKPEVDA